MKIEFKNSVGTTVGHVEGDDVFDTYGNKIGQVGEWGIYSSSGDAGNTDGGFFVNDIVDASGNKVGSINGNDIYGNDGWKAGYATEAASGKQMAAAALLLLKLQAKMPSEKVPKKNVSDSGTSRPRPERSENSGCLGWFGYIFGMLIYLLTRTKGGFIGTIAGAVLGVAVTVFIVVDGGDFFNSLFLGVFGTVLLTLGGGIIGNIIHGIVKLIMLAVEKSRK